MLSVGIFLLYNTVANPSGNLHKVNASLHDVEMRWGSKADYAKEGKSWTLVVEWIFAGAHCSACNFVYGAAVTDLDSCRAAEEF